MRIKSLKTTLLKGVQPIQNIITGRSALPILSNILMETQQNNIRFTGTDLDIGISCVVPVEVVEGGSVTIPAKKFGEIIKELPDGEVVIHAGKNNIVTIECNRSFFKLMGLPKEEFPKLPELTNQKFFTMEQPLLKTMLNMTSFAISHDETRYILNGVLFAVKHNLLKLVATDGRRLALVERELASPTHFQKEVILPNKAVQELNRALQDEGDVKITIGENQLSFEIDNICIISRLIEGEFPNYEQVIPKKSKERIVINKEQFLLALKRASLLTTPDSQSVKINILKDKVIISKITPEVGETKEEIDVDNKTGELSIGFNPNYLMDVLKNLPQEDVEMELSTPENPGVIRVKDSYVYIVLPMQLT